MYFFRSIIAIVLAIFVTNCFALEVENFSINIPSSYDQRATFQSFAINEFDPTKVTLEIYHYDRTLATGMVGLQIVIAQGELAKNLIKFPHDRMKMFDQFMYQPVKDLPSKSYSMDEFLTHTKKAITQKFGKNVYLYSQFRQPSLSIEGYSIISNNKVYFFILAGIFPDTDNVKHDLEVLNTAIANAIFDRQLSHQTDEYYRQHIIGKWIVVPKYYSNSGESRLTLTFERDGKATEKMHYLKSKDNDLNIQGSWIIKDGQIIKNVTESMAKNKTQKVTKKSIEKIIYLDNNQLELVDMHDGSHILAKRVNN